MWCLCPKFNIPGSALGQGLSLYVIPLVFFSIFTVNIKIKNKMTQTNKIMFVLCLSQLVLNYIIKNVCKSLQLVV